MSQSPANSAIKKVQNMSPISQYCCEFDLFCSARLKWEPQQMQQGQQMKPFGNQGRNFRKFQQGTPQIQPWRHQNMNQNYPDGRTNMQYNGVQTGPMVNMNNVPVVPQFTQPPPQVGSTSFMVYGWQNDLRQNSSEKVQLVIAGYFVIIMR